MLCDVIDIDVCHLILGRPWQFDIGETSKCQPNIYTFEWKGSKLRLLLPSPMEIPKIEKESALHIIKVNQVVRECR